MTTEQFVHDSPLGWLRCRMCGARIHQDDLTPEVRESHLDCWMEPES